MKLDLQSLFGLHMHSCTHWLRPCNPPSSRPPAFGLIYEGAIGQPRQMTSLCDPLAASYCQFQLVLNSTICIIQIQTTRMSWGPICRAQAPPCWLLRNTPTVGIIDNKCRARSPLQSNIPSLWRQQQYQSEQYRTLFFYLRENQKCFVVIFGFTSNSKLLKEQTGLLAPILH